MIQPQSLRIGNYIHYPFHNEDVQVCGIVLQHDETIGIQVFTQNTHDINPPSVFHPIPLTEDILLRLGFERCYKGAHLDKYECIEDISLEVVIPKVLGRSMFARYQGMAINTEYVHELQNVAFIFGTELTFKDK